MRISVRGTPNFPNFLWNMVTSCDNLWFCAIIYTKVALSCTTDGPLSMCHILFWLYHPPFHYCSNAITLHFHIISLTISNVIYIPYSCPISLRVFSLDPPCKVCIPQLCSNILWIPLEIIWALCLIVRLPLQYLPLEEGVSIEGIQSWSCMPGREI